MEETFTTLPLNVTNDLDYVTTTIINNTINSNGTTNEKISSNKNIDKIYEEEIVEAPISSSIGDRT